MARLVLVAAMTALIAAPVAAQNVGRTRSQLVQSDPGEQMYLGVRCNPRDLDESPRVATELDDLDGIYEAIGFGFTGEVKVPGGQPHSFAKNSDSIYDEEIPKSALLEAINDGTRLRQGDLHFRFTGNRTGFSIERCYPQAVVHICALMAAVCGDRDYALACGSRYVRQDSGTLVEKLRRILDEHDGPPSPVR